MPETSDDLRKRVMDGEWLGPTQVAKLLGVHRKTVHNMLDDGRLAWRWHSGGRIREVDPVSVRRFLDAASEVHRGRTERIEPSGRSPDATE